MAQLEYPFEVYLGLAAFLTTVSILSAILNTLVIVVFIKIYRKDHKLLHLLIISLAGADLLPALASYPLTAYRTYQNDDNAKTTVECGFEGICIQIAALVSVTHLAFMACERYMVISSGTSKILSFKWHVIILISIWIYGIVISSMPLMGWSSYQPEGLEMSCTVNWRSKMTEDLSYNIVLMLCDFILPLMVIVYSYTRLFLFTRNNGFEKRWIDSVVNIGPWRARKRNSRALAVMVFIMVLLFLGAWAPYFVVSTWSMVTAKHQDKPLLATIPSVFAKSFTLFNPIVYGIKHYKFRATIRKKLLRLLGRRSRKNTFYSSSNASRSLNLDSGVSGLRRGHESIQMRRINRGSLETRPPTVRKRPEISQLEDGDESMTYGSLTSETK